MVKVGVGKCSGESQIGTAACDYQHSFL